MAAPAHHVRYTWAEYLALEAASNVRHEFLDGQIYAMAGGTPEHAALAAAVGGLLFGQLRGGPCRVYNADLRVHVAATGLATYPDVAVICGPRIASSLDSHAVTNPTLLVEVLSPSTEGYDRGDKFEHYKRLPALQTYVLVAQHERRIEVFTRGDGESWSHTVARDGEHAALGALAARLEVRELYDAAAEPLA